MALRGTGSYPNRLLKASVFGFMSQRLACLTCRVWSDRPRLLARPSHTTKFCSTKRKVMVFKRNDTRNYDGITSARIHNVGFGWLSSIRNWPCFACCARYMRTLFSYQCSYRQHSLHPHLYGQKQIAFLVKHTICDRTPVRR